MALFIQLVITILTIQQGRDTSSADVESGDDWPVATENEKTFIKLASNLLIHKVLIQIILGWVLALRLDTATLLNLFQSSFTTNQACMLVITISNPPLPIPKKVKFLNTVFL